MTILYLCFNPSSPFVTTPPTAYNITTPLGLTDPLPNRGWYNWNGARLFDPPLVGYQPVSAVPPASASAASAMSSALGDPDAAAATPGEITPVEPTASEDLPKGYYDLSWKGLGFVLDLGWKRTEEGMRWEGNVGTWEPPKRDEQAGTRDAEASGVVSVDAADTTAATAEAKDMVESVTPSGEAGKKDVEIARGKGWRWTRSFVGDL